MDGISENACPECQRILGRRILYGYPTRVDHDGPSTYSRQEFTTDSPTHWCLGCQHQWQAENVEPLYFPLPTCCHFCGETISKEDQSVFKTEFDNWLEPLGSPFQLKYESFSDDPFPTCGTCRKEIQLNNQELEKEKNRDELWRKRLQKFYATLLLMFVILIIWVLFFGG